MQRRNIDSQMKDVENKHQTADTEQVKTERFSEENNRNPPERTNEDMSPPKEQSIDRPTAGANENQIELRNISKKEHGMLVIDTSQTQTEKIEVQEEEIKLSLNEEQWHIVKEAEVEKQQDDSNEGQLEKEEKSREVSQLQKIQRLQDTTDPPNKTCEKLTIVLEAKHQMIEKLTRKSEEYQGELEKVRNENERCVIQISHLESEKQALQDRTDTLNKTNEDMGSVMKSQQEEMNRLKRDLEEHLGELDKSQKENERCVMQISQLETQKQTVREQRDSLENSNEEMTSNMQSQQQEMKRMKGDLGEMQKKLETLLNENKRAVIEIEDLQKGKQTLQDQTDSLNKIKEELSSTLETKEQDVNNLRGELEETHNELDKIQKENENYVEQILKLQTENQTFQDQRDTSGKTNEEMASNIECQQQEMEKNQNERDETQTELEEVQMENEKNAKDKFQLQSERKSMMDKLFSIKYGMDEMSSTTEGLQQDIAAFLTELVKGDGKSSFEESRRFKRKAVVMRLLCTSRSGLGKIMVDMVTKELTRQLGGRQDLRKFEISIVLPNTSKGVSKGPLFVVCLNTMVLKHVPDALEGPKGGKDVYLLVLHQTTRENLSTLRPDSLRNTGSELRQLGGVIDMVFSSESGLFECNINNTAFEQITTVLKKY